MYWTIWRQLILKFKILRTTCCTVYSNHLAAILKKQLITEPPYLTVLIYSMSLFFFTSSQLSKHLYVENHHSSVYVNVFY